MADSAPNAGVDRRRFFSRVIAATVGGIGATLAAILGTSVVAPVFARRADSWLPAGSLSDLEENVPQPVALRVTRDDGYYEAIDRPVVFLVKTGERDVKAISSTCTHLGCRVNYDSTEQLLKCPCHGGVYTIHGQVKSGPPPRPLAVLPARIDGDTVLVQV
jgi:Rieske Fe-S protein